MSSYVLFIIFSYLAIGFGLVTINSMGFTVNESVKFSLFWFPLLIVYLAFLRGKN